MVMSDSKIESEKFKENLNFYFTTKALNVLSLMFHCKIKKRKISYSEIKTMPRLSGLKFSGN